MLNLKTLHVIVSQDIIWLNRMHGEDTPTNLIPPQEDELFEDDIEMQPDNVPSGQPHAPAPVQAPVPPTAPAPCLPRELRNLQSDLAPQLLEPGNRQTGRERLNLMLDNYLPDFAFLSALVSEAMHKHDEYDDDKKEVTNETIKEPKTFQEAWHHPNLNQQPKWREAIKKELKDMINRGVFQKVKR